MSLATVPLDTLHTVETPEGITLALRPAGIVPRTLAYLIDMLIRAGVFLVIVIMGRLLGGVGMALLLISLFALEWLYPVVFELTRHGATPGKRALGLRVVTDAGLPVTPAASLLRNLLRAADFMPGAYAVGVVAMLLRPDCKRLGDMAAGTLVVYAGAVQLSGELPAAAPLPPARPLTAREQLAVLTWAGRAQRLTPERFDELARLAQGVCMRHADDDTGDASQRLLGVANWLSGRRTA
jgi:uncharacterized RDD family membrane protein YckC